MFNLFIFLMPLSTLFCSISSIQTTNLQENDAKLLLEEISLISGYYGKPVSYYTYPQKQIPFAKTSSRNVVLLGDVGYFRPTKSRFRSIYGSSLINYRVSLQVQLWKQLYALVDTNLLHKKGASIGVRNATKILLIPVDIGIKYYLPTWDWLSFYFKAAGEITGTFIENQTTFVEDVRQSSAGAVGGVGAFLSFGEEARFCLDVFADYSFVKLHTFGTATSEGGRTELGGLILGGGLGCKF